jgi:hypothetical protein
MSGNQHDLRLLRLLLQEQFPEMEFLMSVANQVCSSTLVSCCAHYLLGPFRRTRMPALKPCLCA